MRARDSTTSWRRGSELEERNRQGFSALVPGVSTAAGSQMLWFQPWSEEQMLVEVGQTNARLWGISASLMSHESLQSQSSFLCVKKGWTTVSSSVTKQSPYVHTKEHFQPAVFPLFEQTLSFDFFFPLMFFYSSSFPGLERFAFPHIFLSGSAWLLYYLN